MADEDFHWRPDQFWFLLKQSAKEWAEDKSPKTAAALAYYMLFALGPLLVIVVAIAGLAFGTEQARSAITDEVSGLLGDQAGDALGGLMSAYDRTDANLLMIVVGSIILVFGSLAAFAQLREGLNKTWEVESKTVDGLWNKIKLALRLNVLSFAGVMGLAFLLIVSLVLSTGITALSTAVQGVLPYDQVVWQVANAAVSVAVTSLAFMLIFKFLPNVEVAWRDVAIGGIVTGILFVAAQLAMGYYFGNILDASRYGAAGAVPILLLWLYYTSLLVLYGAEMTQVYANKYGQGIRIGKYAESIQQAVAKRHQAPSREGTERKPGKPSEAPA